LKKIGVLIEAHYDETEYNMFNEAFTKDGYELDYLSYLWGQDSLKFTGNDHTSEVTVDKCVTKVNVSDYAAVILIGGYATDRLRYQTDITPGKPNASPAVEFLRKAVAEADAGRLKIGTICHSLWLFCADNALLKGRRVTCAHNIVCDVENAGGVVEFDGTQTKEIVIDGGLITAKHPGITELFIKTLKDELEK
jgi:putative intracellular protease/amidase